VAGLFWNRRRFDYTKYCGYLADDPGGIPEERTQGRILGECYWIDFWRVADGYSISAGEILKWRNSINPITWGCFD
jgi:hypothetical protein